MKNESPCSHGPAYQPHFSAGLAKSENPFLPTTSSHIVNTGVVQIQFYSIRILQFRTQLFTLKPAVDSRRQEDSRAPSEYCGTETPRGLIARLIPYLCSGKGSGQ